MHSYGRHYIIRVAPELIRAIVAFGTQAQTYTINDRENWLAQPTMTGDRGGLQTQLPDRGINWQT
jgi:hypothetical protein